MNYLAHARPFLDRPPFMAGTSVPDWLTVIDRQVRVRRRGLLPICRDEDSLAAQFARGMLQHLIDDARFHQTETFIRLQVQWGVQLRDRLGDQGGFRTSFLAHLLIEVLLDAVLIEQSPELPATYYRNLQSIDWHRLADVVNRAAAHSTYLIPPFVKRFLRARIFDDYTDDARLFPRLNQVMHRVGLAPLPKEILAVLPALRRSVAAHQEALLEGIPAPLDLDS